MNKVTEFSADQLYFDVHNPRLVEFAISEGTSEDVILNTLWSEMAVDEIVLSILANGYFENEAMLAVKEKGKYVVVEGNRRLAAVKVILKPDLLADSGMDKYKNRITPELVEKLTKSLPVIVLDSRENAWRYIGFKHVNGAAKWGSYAKAQYIATVHLEYKVSLDDIALQIGDTNKTVRKLYQGLMFINQAERNTSFKKDDSYYGRIYFSHLYTAIQYDGFQQFLGIQSNVDSSNPVPSEKLNNLEECMCWLFGSKSKKVKPIIVSQNPDLKRLNKVLLSKEATEALRVTSDLLIAYDLSLDSSTVLYSSLVESRISLEKAMSKISSYKGDIDTLKVSGSVANLADNIYNSLDRKKNEIEGKFDKRRLTE